MSAQDVMNENQFTTLYHGTTPEAAAAIAKKGMRSTEGHIYPALWPVLTENRQTAEAYTRGAGDTVVELHVPKKDFWEESRTSGKLWPGQPHMGGPAYAVRKHLPAKYVAGVHEVKERPEFPK